jgi:hypothetical protein
MPSDNRGGYALGSGLWGFVRLRLMHRRIQLAG